MATTPSNECSSWCRRSRASSSWAQIAHLRTHCALTGDPGLSLRANPCVACDAPCGALRGGEVSAPFAGRQKAWFLPACYPESPGGCRPSGAWGRRAAAASGRGQAGRWGSCPRKGGLGGPRTASPAAVLPVDRAVERPQSPVPEPSRPAGSDGSPLSRTSAAGRRVAAASVRRLAPRSRERWAWEPPWPGPCSLAAYPQLGGRLPPEAPGAAEPRRIG
jgi:hypothetical protein